MVLDKLFYFVFLNYTKIFLKALTNLYPKKKVNELTSTTTIITTSQTCIRYVVNKNFKTTKF